MPQPQQQQAERSDTITHSKLYQERPQSAGSTLHFGANGIKLELLTAARHRGQFGYAGTEGHTCDATNTASAMWMPRWIQMLAEPYSHCNRNSNIRTTQQSCYGTGTVTLGAMHQREPHWYSPLTKFGHRNQFTTIRILQNMMPQLLMYKYSRTAVLATAENPGWYSNNNSTTANVKPGTATTYAGISARINWCIQPPLEETHRQN
jgi:hypothetical protein